jgi:hypothetical protein
VGSTWISKLEPLSVFTETFISSTPPPPNTLPRRRRRSRRARGVGGGEQEGEFFFSGFFPFCSSGFSISALSGRRFCQLSPRGLTNLHAWCCFWKVSKSGEGSMLATSWTVMDRNASCTSNNISRPRPEPQHLFRPITSGQKP